MNNIEKIKFGTQEFDLIPAGVDLGENGGKISFQKGNASFDDIETLLKTNGGIVQIELSGEQDWSREDLVYAGQLTKKSDQVIGTAEDGVTPITADVMIASFRTPDLTETVKEQAAEIKSLRATVDALVLSSLEV